MCAFPAAQCHVGTEYDLSSHEENKSFAKSLMRRQLRHQCVGSGIAGSSSGGPLANFQDLYRALQHAFEFTRFQKDSSGLSFLHCRDFP